MALKREEIHVICHINPDVIIAIIEQQEVRMAQPESHIAELEA